MVRDGLEDGRGAGRGSLAEPQCTSRLFHRVGVG